MRTRRLKPGASLRVRKMPLPMAAAGWLCLLALMGLGPVAAAAELLPLEVSRDAHQLVTSDGQPFFWLGDTAWSMFNQSVKQSRDDQPGIDFYLETRVRQGFTVIQSHFLTIPVRGPIGGPNAYGHVPFIAGDFSRPRVIPGPGNDYWDYADYLVKRTRHYGLYLAVAAVWSSGIPEDSDPLVADPGIAYRYGWFLGNRYRGEPHIIWLLGGDTFGPREDRRTLTQARLRMTRALAEGIADGVNGVDAFDGTADYTSTLMSYHPPGGGRSSAEYFHEEEWLDFNMIQTTSRLRFLNYRSVARDYARTPPKPVLDGEVAYEYSLPLSGRDRRAFPGRRVSPWDVRRGAYWDIFSGGFGHTYGHRNLIGWVRAGEAALKYGANRPWFESMEAPGARQMTWLRRLMESRPMAGRIPDQSLIDGEQSDGNDYACAIRDRGGRYGMVYLPTGKRIRIRTNAIRGPRAVAWWFNPRTGTAQRKGEVPTTGAATFEAPTRGERQDWVLVLDSVTASFPTPGKPRKVRSRAGLPAGGPRRQ